MRALRGWVVAIAFAGMMISPAHAQVDAPARLASVHAEMGRALREEGLVGAVWALLMPGEIATGAAGLHDARREERLTSTSRVHVGSVAKTLIATGVLRLVTEGKLSLDTPVASLLPDITFHNPWAESHPLLVRHLLDQTSGLEDARFWQVFSVPTRIDTPLSKTLDRDPSLLRLRTRPGSRFSYSNIGYTALGMVIEKVTGERYERYLAAHLLRPLGMNSSSFEFVSQTGPRADARLAMGHFENGATHAAVPSYLRPAGQFTTTAGDMALLARFLMSDGAIQGAPFIDSRLLRAMGRASTTEAAAAGLPAGYALGLARRDRHGAVGLCHEGTTVGYRAMLCLFPEEQKAFFVSMNADSETADYGRFHALLMEALDIRKAVSPVATVAPPDIAGWQGVYEVSPTRIEPFAYVDLVLNFAVVRWDGAKLHLKPFQAAVKSLTPAGGLLFRSHDRATVSHALLRSSDGNRVITDGFRTFEEVSLWRIVPLWVSLAAGVLGLAYLILAGVARMARRRLRPSDPLFAPFLAVVALALPIPFFLGQSFMRLGDVTPASVLLALVTGVLPLMMALGLWRRFTRGMSKRSEVTEALAMLAVLQWTVVLAFWKLVPMRLWV